MPGSVVNFPGVCILESRPWKVWLFDLYVNHILFSDAGRFNLPHPLDEHMDHLDALEGEMDLLDEQGVLDYPGPPLVSLFTVCLLLCLGHTL